MIRLRSQYNYINLKNNAAWQQATIRGFYSAQVWESWDRPMQKPFVEIFNNILGSIREPLVVLDSDLKVVKANHSFYQTFNVTPDKTEGVLI